MKEEPGPKRAPQTPSRPVQKDYGALLDADPECDHDVESLWDGVKCKKCPGWFCY